MAEHTLVFTDEELALLGTAFYGLSGVVLERPQEATLVCFERLLTHDGTRIFEQVDAKIHDATKMALTTLKNEGPLRA